MSFADRFKDTDDHTQARRREEDKAKIRSSRKPDDKVHIEGDVTLGRQERPSPQTTPTPEKRGGQYPHMDVDAGWEEYKERVGENLPENEEQLDLVRVAFYTGYTNCSIDILNTLSENKGQSQISFFQVYNKVYGQFLRMIESNKEKFEVFHVGVKKRGGR